MKPIYPEIFAGELIASKLKIYFFGDRPWTPNMAFAIGARLTELKRMTRPFYPELATVALLNKLGTYGQADITDAFDSHNANGKEATCKPEDEKSPKSMASLTGRSMANK